MSAAVIAAGLLLPAAGVFWPAASRAADGKFYFTLDPAPMTMATRANVTGTGSVTAPLNGDVLSVQGRFSNLGSPATDAYLRTGAMTDMPGEAFADIGDYDREFTVVDVKTGKTHWKVQLGNTVLGHPITFRVEGKRYVVVTTGYGGGSPEAKPSTMLTEVHRPRTGKQLNVFALPDGY